MGCNFESLERGRVSLRHQIGERDLQRRRAGDQDHVISYSHAGERRISAGQALPCHLAQAAPGPVAVHRRFRSRD